METLLDLAEMDYNAAFNMIKVDDELYLRLRCYLTQQAIEKLLKYAIEIRGRRCPITHMITKLYSEYLAAGYPEVDNMNVMSTVLEVWEARSRYNMAFSTTMQQIDIARQIYSDIHSIITGNLTFDAERYIRNAIGDKYSLLPVAAVKECKNEEDCNQLITSLKHLF